MKKPTLPTRHVLIYSTILFCLLANAQDFTIQHIQDNVTNSGIAGASGFAEVTNTGITTLSSLNNAFALPTNNRKTHAGRSDLNSSALEGNDMAGARVLTATGTLTYYRETGSIADAMRFNTDIWEYTGTAGGANEFIVRGRYVASLPSGGTGLGFTYVDIDVSGAGIVSPNKCVPIITGIMNDDTVNGADSGTGIAHLDSATNLVVRKGTNDNNVTIFITLVEFTGSNWTVLHGNTTSTAATGSITLYDGYDATGTATNVSDWSNSIIFTQSKAQTAASGGEKEKIRSQWPLMTPGADNQTVDWTFDPTRLTTNNSNRHFIHVLNNPDITVNRFTDNVFAAGETTIDISSAGLNNLAQSSIIGNTITAGNGTGYAQGYRNYYLNSTTELAHWCARSGNSLGVSHNIQVINLSEPNTGPGGFASNIQLWLKADSGVEELVNDIAEDGDPVLNWLDNSTNGNDAEQTTLINRPIFTEASINFNPTIDFDGTNHEMLANTVANDSISIFVVGEGTFGIPRKNIINLNNGSGATGSVALQLNSTTELKGRYFDGTIESGEVSATVSDGVPFLVDYEFLANAGTSQLFQSGVSQGTDVTTNTDALTGTLDAGIGTSPINSSRRWDGGIAEIIVYNKKLTVDERDKAETYFAIKYGFTLGVNGTSQDYKDSDNRTIWDAASHTGFNYNVTGIGRDDASGLSQKQSRTINTEDDITIGIKSIETTNAANTADFFADKTFLMWGHDNGATTPASDITKDFGSSTSTTTNLSVTPMTRIWKIVNSDSIPTIKLSIPESMVSATNAGGEEYVMIVSDDATFTTNVTSATMEDVGTDLEVDFYFEGTKYITFGSAPISTTLSRSMSFDRTGDTYLTAGNVNDLANTDFTISAWVKRNTGAGKFDIVSKRNYFNENRDIDPGVDNDGNYTHGYAFRINSSNQFRMVWRDPDDASNNVLQTSSTIPEDEWHHIAATYSSSTNTTSLYIDGYLEDSDNTLNPMNTPSDSHFMIGAAHHIKRQQKLDGAVDEVRVWNVALTGDQIRYIMNQEIEENATFVDGKVLPTSITKNEINAIPWNNLIAYYPMSRFVFGSTKDESNSGNDASMINFNHVDAQTAPLPYQTTQNGDWDDTTTWLNGDVQYLPGVDSYLTALETINYNIVQINHEITMDNSDTSLIPASNNGVRSVYGLKISSSGKLTVVGDTSTNEGYGLLVSHYLELDGKLDLEGESQLIQTEDSDLDVTSAGTLERDQQGTKDLYTYNYWSSPVGVSNISTNNNSYTLGNNIMKNGTVSATPNNITFLTTGYDGNVSGSDIEIADYWIWKYVNFTSDSYSGWQHVRSTGSLNPGEGFTMKGVESSGSSFTSTQNYVFDGKPNNGDITLTISAGNDYLVGNPYASALDADEFIKDNISNLETNGRNTSGNIINGALYFWDHFAVNSHYLADYQGGYATYTLMGGAVAVNNDTRINNTGDPGTKTPGRYIPIGQGFFVSATVDSDLSGAPNDPTLGQPIVGGDLLFKNSQRVFEKEGTATSIFVKSSNTKSKNSVSTKQTTDGREKIRLMFDSPRGYHRQLLVGADENCTTNFDIGYDAILLDDNLEDCYWINNSLKMTIQGVDNFNEDQALPIGVKIDISGITTIRIDNLENISSDKSVILHDKALSTLHDLREGSYDIFLENGTYGDRFELVFSNPATLNAPENTNNNIQIHASNKNQGISISNPKSTYLKHIEIYNLLGQEITIIDINNNDKKLDLKDIKTLETGIYVVKLKTEHHIITKKIILRG
ncbi:hypothetical protein MHTCC0001_17230 [Flavobacteriaceae bacterium MHTCC 0001]